MNLWVNEKENGVAPTKSPADHQGHGDAPADKRLLQQKIAAQDRALAKARHAFQRIKAQLDQTGGELAKSNALPGQAAPKAPCSRYPHHPGRSYFSLPTHPPSIGSMPELIQAQLLGLMNATADHIFMLSEAGIYIFSNDQVKQFGLKDGAALVGKRLKDVYHPDVWHLYSEKLKEVIASRKALTFYHQKKTTQGSEYHRDTLYPVVMNNRLYAVGGVCCNISEQKGTEKQLVQAQKMEALGTLVAGVAHEINNPINLVLFNLPLLEKMWQDLLPILVVHAQKMPDKKIGGLPPDFVKENLPRLISDMEMAANRVARIVSGLKGFARKSNPAEKSNISVNVAVNNAARLADATLKKSKATMALDLAPDPPVLRANMQNIEQIVLNLIINALESIGHDHGEVGISTKWVQANNTIVIKVTDNGRGVNPAVAEKIFDPFVTDRQTVGGTGLGLSVTYNLVKAHKGDIYFESRDGGGTCFTVVLPTDTKRKSYKVMVVDDDADFRGLIIRAISPMINCSIEDFANGAEALIRMGSHPPDLLVLDMFMPEMDGLGVCRAIKNELGLDQMKIIIVTGFPDHPNLYEAARMGFDQILTKPLSISAFTKMVSQSLDE